MIGIYKITSPVGKVYVGQSVDIELRWRRYGWLEANTQHRLYNSFNKYGVTNHIFEVLEECEECMLNEKERYWQDFFNVVEEGLNLKLTNTDDRSGRMSSESKRKMVGRVVSSETRRKISKANTGKVRSEEFRQNVSNSKKGKTYPSRKKPSPETIRKRALANTGRRSTTREEVQLIIQLRQNGARFKDISQQIGKSIYIIKRALKENSGSIINSI